MPVDIRRDLKSFLKYLLDAKEKGRSEADTVLLLVEFFKKVLGYDPIADITRELQVLKGKYVDIALKVDDVVKLLVEAKAAGETLRDRHIDQAQSYAAYTNYRWAILTNGTAWKLYHMTGETEEEHERVFDLDLSNPSEFDAAAEKLAILHKQSVKKGQLEEYRSRSAALSPATIARAIFTEKVIGDIRAEIHREMGPLIDPEDLAKAIHDMLSQEVRDSVGPLKIRRRRQGTKRAASSGQASAGQAGDKAEAESGQAKGDEQPKVQEGDDPKAATGQKG